MTFAMIQIYYNDNSTLFDARDYKPLIDINAVMTFLCNKDYNIPNLIIATISKRNYKWVQFTLRLLMRRKDCQIIIRQKNTAYLYRISVNPFKDKMIK